VHQILDLLVRECPEWSSVTPSDDGLDVIAEVVLADGRKDDPVSLHVWAGQDRIWVRENSPRRWPACCPERHIEAGGTFCLGIGDPVRPSTRSQARTWWSWLQQYIVRQRCADKTGIWPSVRALHHGDAHKHQLELERISAGTPFEEDVRDALEDGVGWLTGPLPKPENRTKAIRLGGWCPKGCRKGGRRISHRRCSHRRLIAALVEEELLRREEESSFWSSFAGVPCCGTMRDCPLKDVINRC
jgi:hypothetical protein